jgi:hypothetical protein
MSILAETHKRWTVLLLTFLACCFGIFAMLMSFPQINRAGVNWNMFHEGVYDIDQQITLRLDIYDVELRGCNWLFLSSLIQSRSKCIRDYDLCIDDRPSGKSFTLDARHRMPLGMDVNLQFNQFIVQSGRHQMGIKRSDLKCQNALPIADIYSDGLKIRIVPLGRAH